MISGQKGHKGKLEVGVAQKAELSCSMKEESDKFRRPLLIKPCSDCARVLRMRVRWDELQDAQEHRLCDKGPEARSPVSE